MRSFILCLIALAACSPSEDDSTPCCDTDEVGTDPNDTDCEEPCGDTDGDGSPDTVDDDNDGWTEAEGDCRDDQPAINPEATDLVGDGIDQNCDDTDGFDGDGDGHADLASGGDDCDDTDPYTFPGAIEIWYDGKAQGCEVGPDEEWDDSDQDGDGHGTTGLGGDDCVDTNPDVNPSQFEVNGNGLDDNCNGSPDGLRATLAWTPSDPTVFTFHFFDDYAGKLTLVSVNGEFEMYTPGTDADGMLLLFGAEDTAFEDEYNTLTYGYTSVGIEDEVGVLCIVWGYDPEGLIAENGLEGDCIVSDPTTW